MLNSYKTVYCKSRAFLQNEKYGVYYTLLARQLSTVQQYFIKRVNKNAKIQISIFLYSLNFTIVASFLTEIWKSITIRPSQNAWNFLMTFNWILVSNVARNTVNLNYL